MWTLRRRTHRAADAAVDGFPGGDEELLAEIERLHRLNREQPSGGGERTLLQLRNLAGLRLMEAAGSSAGHPDPDFARLPDGDRLPEIDAGDVTPELLRAGILRHGCLLVRGLVARDDAVRFAEEIERSYEERDRHDEHEPFSDRYYSEFMPDPRRRQDLARGWIKAGGGLLAVDSPLLSSEMRELLERAGLPELVESYLGEAPLVAAEKTTLRKAAPTVPGAWHQDGKFMGEVNALNLWLSLSHCGDEAPGLDVVPRRIDHHVVTETDEAMFDNMVSQRVAEQAAGDAGIVRPIFEPGDAMLFDELFLHKTGSDPAMSKPRFAIENWFFGASGFPADYAPLSV
jgi:Phytanoyl-CoA dioxygenase (PhyH)